MFDAFKIGVTVFLQNQVSQGLNTLARQFRQAGNNVTHLQRQIQTLQLMMRTGLVNRQQGNAQLATLNQQLVAATGNANALHTQITRVNRLLTTGGVMLGAGMALGSGFKSAMGAGEEYLNRVQQLEQAGFKEKELHDAIQLSWKTTRDVITTSVSDNIQAFLDMYNVFNRFDVAAMALPKVQKAETVMRASGMGEKAKGQAYDAAKAIDMMNKSGTEADFSRNLESMMRVAQITGNRITPETYRMNLRYMRQARYSLSEEFLYSVLPTFMIDVMGRNGGSGSHGGVGVPINALHKMVVQGVLNKTSAKRLKALGAFGGDPVDLKASKGLKKMGYTGEVSRVRAGLTGSDLARKDQFEWAQNVLLPLIYKKHGKVSDDQLIELINYYFAGNPQTGLDWLLGLSTRGGQVYRDKSLYPRAPGMEEAYQLALSKSPATAREGLAAQWHNLQVALTEKVLPHLFQAALKGAEVFNWLALSLRDHPGIAKALGYAWIALTVALPTAGTIILLAGAFSLLTGRALFPAIASAIGTVIGAAGTGLTGLAAVFGLPVWATIAGIAAGLTALAAAFQLFQWANSASPEDVQKLAGGPSGPGTAQYPDWMYTMFGQTPPGRGVLPPARGGVPIMMTGSVNLDGQRVGSIVSRNQGLLMDRPTSSSSVYDTRMGYGSAGQSTEP